LKLTIFLAISKALILVSESKFSKSWRFAGFFGIGRDKVAKLSAWI
jgi:hypothetical protein